MLNIITRKERERGKSRIAAVFPSVSDVRGAFQHVSDLAITEKDL